MDRDLLIKRLINCLRFRHPVKDSDQRHLTLPSWEAPSVVYRPGRPVMQFYTDDMTCGGCLRAITRAVHAVDPQAQVAADLADHRVEVTTRQPRAQIAAAIETAGFRLRGQNQTGDRA
jgi:copper chaperone